MANKFLLTTVISVSLFTGCAVNQSIVETKESVLSPVDKGLNSSKSTYEKTSFFFKDIYSGIEDTMSSLKSTMIENPLGLLVLSDEYILENRKDLVIWDKATPANEKRILKRYLKNKKIKIDYNGLSQSKKLSYLNSYYFDVFKSKYENEVKRKFKKPRFNEFISNRENINKFDEYNLNMLEATNLWLLNMKTTKKKVAEKSFSTLFGNPIVTYVHYNPNAEKMYLRVKSTKNTFSRKVYINVEPALAEKMKNNSSSMKAIVLHKLSDENLEFIGINIVFNNKNVIAVISDENYVRERIQLVSNDKLDLKKDELTYFEVSKDVETPTWFNSIKEEDSDIIGYGMELKKDDAKAKAIQSITDRLYGVRVESETIIKKKQDGQNSSKTMNSTVHLKSNGRLLKNISELKVERKDNYWFIAMKYKKN